ncbi:TadE/TadG family type IV pilus assembly protein [Longispora albida]|uniref:TadE/TadG family type IV pilus assembly protein n=1 Tax=Longispora albida TaxID=203523 RepID=UPI0003613D0C|nr:TadE/TadG family type IV pilus assembly protein [Longispora albida]
MNRREDRGGVSVEMAIAVPMVVLMLFLLIGGFNYSRGQIAVSSAAGSAARAASLQRSPAGAQAAAIASAHANLDSRCARVTAAVNTGSFQRGGQVAVTVTCTVSTRGLTGVGLGGSLDITASATSPLDVYRGVALGHREDR